MSLYSDIFDQVAGWTTRTDLSTEIDAAIRQAVRAAHRVGTFYKDLATLTLTGQSTGQIQTIDLSVSAPLYRQLAYVKPTDIDMVYKEAHILDLFDPDGYYRTDVYWAVGTTLNIRAANPAENITLVYYKNPTLTPIASLDSWIATDHQDLIVYSAAASICAMTGEQEIKQRVEMLAAAEKADLLSAALFVTGR